MAFWDFLRNLTDFPKTVFVNQSNWLSYRTQSAISRILQVYCNANAAIWLAEVLVHPSVIRMQRLVVVFINDDLKM